MNYCTMSTAHHARQAKLKAENAKKYWVCDQTGEKVSDPFKRADMIFDGLTLTPTDELAADLATDHAWA